MDALVYVVFFAKVFIRHSESIHADMRKSMCAGMHFKQFPIVDSNVHRTVINLTNGSCNECSVLCSIKTFIFFFTFSLSVIAGVG